MIGSTEALEASENGTPFVNFFNTNYFILKISALWLPVKASKTEKFLRILYTIVVIIILLIYQPAESAVMLVNPTLERFLRSLRDQGNHFMCFFKMTRWFAYRITIFNIIDELQDQKYNYEEFGLIDSKKTVKIYKKQSEKWMLAFLISVNMICSSMFLSVVYVFIFKSEENYDFDENGKRIYVQQLPVNLVTPIDNTNRTAWMLIFLFEIYCLDMHAWMIVGLDCNFTSLMACVSAHLEILQEAFKTIRPRCMLRLGMEPKEILHDTLQLQTEMNREIKKCIEHLNMLLEVSFKIEHIYHMQTWLQAMISLFEMCLCLYFLSSAVNEDAPAELMFLLSTSFELFLYSWFGNAVTEASKDIPNAIYEGDWLSSSASFKRSMLITMTRMRKPIYMTVGKFSPLTYSTFVSLAKVAYSFFTVLKSDSVQ